MPNPTRAQVHVDRPLTNISIAHIQSADSFVAGRVFPIIPVSKQSDTYFRYNRGDFNRDEMRKRAPGTESAGGGYNLDTDSYTAHVWAFHKDIDDQTLANYDEPLDASREATIFVTQKALINREVEWAKNFFDVGGGQWGTDIAGHASVSTPGTQVIHWNVAASNPITDIAYYQNAMLKATGFEPNVLVLGKAAWDGLKNNEEILTRVQYGGNNSAPAMVTKQALAALFEVDEIVVMKAIATTTAEPTATSFADTQNYIGNSNGGLLCYRPPSVGLMTPAAGYTFAWTGLLGSSTFGTRITTLPMPQLKSDRIEIESAYAQKIVGPDLGIYFSELVP